ncbi:MAG TPA: uroporphyrinogen decarboxylase family protein [Ruminiclostridium sp.]
MRKTQVLKAIKMQGPDYVPVFFFNKDKDQSDIIQVDIQKHFGGTNKNTSEWGFVWETKDETMGQPIDTVIKDWEQLDSIILPDPYVTDRFEEAEQIIKLNMDKFLVAGLSLTGFTTMTLVAGFENVLEGLYLERENVEKLADMVFGFEEKLIELASAYPFDAVNFADDWGTQNSLIISPKLWREFFKPRYKRQFDLIHEKGMSVIFHCCGNIYDIIPDFIEIGVDVLNLSQPNLFDIEKLGKDYGGKVCFMCPVSYQTTSISGTKEDIYKDVKSLVDNLGSCNGGLLGYIEEYHSVGMSDDNYQSCINAFKEIGRYK